MRTFYFKKEFQRYNSLEMDEGGKMLEQKFPGVDFQKSPTDDHTWAWPVFFLSITVGKAGRSTRMGTKVNNRSIPSTLSIYCRVSGTSIKHHNWACFPPVPCGIWRHIINCGSHEEGKSPSKLEKLVEEHSDLSTQEKSTLSKEWNINEYSSIPLPREEFKEDSLELGTQELPPGYDPQVTPSIMI